MIRKGQRGTSRSSEEVVERAFYMLDSYALFKVESVVTVLWLREV